MESRFLNVSIMQHTITADLDTNLRVIEDVYKRQLFISLCLPILLLDIQQLDNQILHNILIFII